MEFMAFHQGGNQTLGEFKVDYMERRATLTAAGIAAPPPSRGGCPMVLVEARPVAARGYDK